MDTGYEIIFITPQNRRHHGKLVSTQVVDIARDLGIDRMTKRLDSEGQGTSGHLHSAHFFELADQPLEIMFLVDRDIGERLIEAVRDAGIHVFCIRKQVEFGELA